MEIGINHQALKESVGDTILATLINFPLIWALNYLTMTVFLFGPFGVSITNTFILFWIAVTRKYYVRVYFDKKIHCFWKTQDPSMKVQEGPRSPPDPLKNYLISGNFYVFKHFFVLPIVLPIVWPARSARVLGRTGLV